MIYKNCGSDGVGHANRYLKYGARVARPVRIY